MKLPVKPQDSGVQERHRADVRSYAAVICRTRKPSDSCSIKPRWAASILDSIQGKKLPLPGKFFAPL
jgi:hypothetical protein